MMRFSRGEEVFYRLKIRSKTAIVTEVNEERVEGGNKRSSRIEFQALPDSARGDFKFFFGFKTISNNSIIFYASKKDHLDFIAFYIKDGKVRKF
ncbi:hypothetical protein E2C01_058986 [Portunus trituberculatus]|uniref:Uncharacterized protein n=1 Tax=Portunus trituberculatus TaxID=210409 RepID=A0A5B7H7U8_PORTR|nr:hypothetical protein [Portunus trituberculatus]